MSKLEQVKERLLMNADLRPEQIQDIMPGSGRQVLINYINSCSV